MTAARLNQIAAATLVVGSKPNAGTLTVNTPIALAPANITNLTLASGGDIALDAAVTISASGGTLTLNAGGAVSETAGAVVDRQHADRQFGRRRRAERRRQSGQFLRSVRRWRNRRRVHQRADVLDRRHDQPPTGTVSLTTTAGNLTVAGDIVAGIVAFNSAGGIIQSQGTIDPGAMLIQSVNSVTLSGPNTIDTLAARITGLGSSLTFNNTANPLTVGTVEAVAGIATNNGAVTLLTTTSGALTVSQQISAGTATVTLNSAGAIATGGAPGIITAGTLTGTAAAAASLTAANAIANLGAFTTAGDFTLFNTVTLTQAALTAVNPGAGAILIDNGGAAFTQGGTLTTASALAAAITIQNTAALSVGTIAAATGGVVLGIAGKPVGATSETGIVTALSLSGNSAGGLALNDANALGQFTAFTNTGSGDVALTKRRRCSSAP